MKIYGYPDIGIGPLKIGMTITEIRNAIDMPNKPFKKYDDDEFLTDRFMPDNIFVFYKKPGICEAIEVSRPCKPKFNGVNLLAQPFEDVKNMMLSLDPDLETGKDGFTSYKLGIGAFCEEQVENPKALIEAIIVFEKGYYNDI